MTSVGELGVGIVRRVSGAAVRWATSPDVSWPTCRRRQLVMAAIPPARGVVTARRRVADVEVDELTPAGASGTWMVLYLHGGAFLLGSARAYRHLTTRVARALGSVTVVPDYRLAPEHPFPAALDDVMAVYEELVRRHGPRVIVAGDSAGGGLTVSLVQRARERGIPGPAAVGLISPWLDLTGGWVDTPGEAFITADFLEAGADAYCAGVGRSDPKVSPLHGDLTGMPALALDISAWDPLVEDGRRLTRTLTATGVPSFVREHPERWHAFHLLAGVFPPAGAALSDFAMRLEAAAGMGNGKEGNR